jgi:hypothetical protein
MSLSMGEQVFSERRNISKEFLSSRVVTAPVQVPEILVLVLVKVRYSLSISVGRANGFIAV